MSTKLKPCPFCGNEGTTGNPLKLTHHNEIECYQCWGRARSEKMWNTRKVEEQLQAENERLKEEMKEMVKTLAAC